MQPIDDWPNSSARSLLSWPDFDAFGMSSMSSTKVCRSVHEGARMDVAECCSDMKRTS